MPMIENIKMVEKHNTLITMNYYTCFVFWGFPFKVCNNACIMPKFGKNDFHKFFTLCF